MHRRGPAADLAVTWWGHSSVTVELGGLHVATDPLLSGRLYHLRRSSPIPPPEAARADVVLVSHLHYDHLHLPSLRQFSAGVPVVVPRGAARAVRGLADLQVLEVDPGDSLEVAGVRVDVLSAHHDGRRNVLSRSEAAPALGFRCSVGENSLWYPGDTGLLEDSDDLDRLESVDLALVPIGGWGPTLGADHLDPEQAASVVARVGARWSLAVHYGTFWPMAMRRLHPTNHQRLFVTPPQRFHDAVAAQGVETVVLTPAFGERIELQPSG